MTAVISDLDTDEAFNAALATLWAADDRQDLVEIDWAALGVDDPFAELDEATREAIALMEPPGARRWRSVAREKQIPPPGEWLYWLIRAGRGFGKTFTGSNTLAEWATEEIGDYAVIAPTFGDAVKICAQGPSGLLKALGEDLDNFNKNEYVLYLRNGSRIVLASADAPDRVRGWNLSGAWCIAEGEPVVTKRGRVPIEQVRVGDLVMTRSGWCAVTAATRTKRNAPTVRITTPTGAVRCTPDHPIWVRGRGWQRADAVRVGDTLLSWNDEMSMAIRPLGRLRGSSGARFAGIAMSRTATTDAGLVISSIMPSGPPSMAPFRTGTRSTIRTTTAQTMYVEILNCLNAAHIPATTERCAKIRGAITKLLTRLVNALRISGRNDGLVTSSARRAVPLTSQQECDPGSALQGAVPSSTVMRIEIDSACDVYDLTVDGAHEFFAGDGALLVHNCDEVGSWKSTEVWYEGLQFALRIGDRPRCVVTTTPRRGSKILLELDRRAEDGSGEVALTRGSMMENAANLSTAVVEMLRKRYEGTTLGRQELDGEQLDEVEGALVTGALIQSTRVRANQVPDLWRIAVAVDPATTSKENSDHTGIVVMGIGAAPRGWQPPAGRIVLAGTPHLYILEDLTIKGSPETWARRALNGADEWQADVLAAEVNQGGDMVEVVCRQLAQVEELYMPYYHGVTASKGKKARAEPVAGVWEQHRIHVVGTSCRELEDQWTDWVPIDSKESPDRLDACVWAAVELMPELGVKAGTMVRLLSGSGAA